MKKSTFLRQFSMYAKSAQHRVRQESERRREQDYPFWQLQTISLAQPTHATFTSYLTKGCEKRHENTLKPLNIMNLKCTIQHYILLRK